VFRIFPGGRNRLCPAGKIFPWPQKEPGKDVQRFFHHNWGTVQDHLLRWANVLPKRDRTPGIYNHKQASLFTLPF
jgi:hypothetical protein